MALEGSLTDFGLPDILQLIGLQRKTGVLKLQGEEGTISVTFENGLIVSVDSKDNPIDEAVVMHMYRMGLMNAETVRRARAVQRSTNQKLSEILILNETIDRQRFNAITNLIVTDKLYRLFRWKTGYYHFEQEDSVKYDRRHFSPISTEHVLMEGVRRVDEWQRMQSRIPSLDIIFARVPKKGEENKSDKKQASLDDDFFDLGLDDSADNVSSAEIANMDGFNEHEKNVYLLIDGNRTVQDVIDMVDQSEFDTFKTFYTLAENGYIKEVSRRSPTTSAARAEAKQKEVDIPRSKFTMLFDWKSVLQAIVVLVVIAGIIYFLKLNPRKFFTLFQAKTSNITHLSKNLVKFTNVEVAIQTYYALKGEFPAGLEILVEEHYLSDDEIMDVWNNEFQYSINSDGYEIISKGPDRKLATSDDIKLIKKVKPGEKYNYYIRVPGSY